MRLRFTYTQNGSTPMWNAPATMTMKKRTMKVLFVFGFRRWNRLTLFVVIVDCIHFCDGCGHLVGCRQVGMIVVVPRQWQQIVDAVDAVF